MSDLIRNQIEGNAVPVPGDEVDTDRIIPARFLKEVTFENMGKYRKYSSQHEYSKK